MRYIILSVCLFIGVMGYYTESLASTPCLCYCKGQNGAEYLGEQSNSVTCRANCSSMYLGCFESADDSRVPENNPLCYSQYECEEDTTEIDDIEVASEWGGQESICAKGEGYCYSAEDPVDLAVSILDPNDSNNPKTSIDSLADYINLVYNFLIPAASLLAVVMIMIAGLQYVLARGDSGKIGKAKGKMKNAVVGLVLLLGAVTIAQFVDPSYVNLARIQPPKVRTVTFLDPNSFCEILENNGFTITAIGKNCGDQGVVSSTGEEQSTWEVGDTCYYKTCPDATQTCIRSAESEGEDGAEEGYACARCAYFDTVGITASPSACENLKHAVAEDDDQSNAYYCEYWETDYLDLDFDQCVELVYPGGNISSNDYIDCDVLAQDYDNSCRGYDEVWSVTTSTTDTELSNELDDIDGEENDFPLLQTVCSEDPCGFAPSGQKCEVLIPSSLGGVADACDSGLGSWIPYCEDIQAEVERVDCINSGYVDLFEKKIDAINNDKDPSEIEDPVCQDKDGSEIDCMETI